MKKEYRLEMNGYSNFFTEKEAVKEREDFTVTLIFTPYTYETCVSGILSNLSADEKRGFAIGIAKGGTVTVTMGVDGRILELDSLKERAKFQKQNVVTFAFWGTAGWCDLYVNGVLANRKQFRRHSRMSLPYEAGYIGKYVDGKDYHGKTRQGVFHGKLESIEVIDEYRSFRQIVSSYRQATEGYEKQKQEGEQGINLYAAQDFSRDIYRPVYHMMPPGKWMNEPHAPFYYGGNYHIFYQANPHAPVWDNLCWGHLVSRDMVRWKDVGIALYPDEEEIDFDGCWSGSACLDSDGVPVLFYTAGNNQELPNQSVAIARVADAEDMELKHWKKEGVVLRQELGKGFLGEFRDPFVWRREDTYYMMVGTGDAENGGGNALLYTSRDLKQFDCHGFVLDYNYDRCREAGHVWELPVMLPLKNENGAYCCDILLFCACQIENEAVENYYFLGKFDYENKKFQKFHEIPRLIDLGCGTFTGPSGFVTPDGRSVVFTIAQGKRRPQEEYDSGWAHNGGMPIVLSVKENVLQIAPVAEIGQYFSRRILAEEIRQEDFGRAVLQKENVSENRMLVSAKGEFLELILEWEDDACIISYQRKTGEWMAVSRKSGRLISKIRNTEDLVDIGNEEIIMDCYIDHSMIEIYLNNKKSMTLRNYPFCKKNKFYVKADGACCVSIWDYDENHAIAGEGGWDV